MIKDRSVYIRHIYDCIGWIKEYVQAGKDLGTDSLTSSHHETPWPQIAATRNFLAHQYLGVDLTLIWNIVEQHLPQLEQQIIEIAHNEGVNLNAPNTPELNF